MAKLRRRGPGYSPQELNFLLDLIEKRLPVDASEWNEVAREHRLTWTFENRTKDSIKRKFASLYRTKARPVSDHPYSSPIRRAIKINHAIKEKNIFGVRKETHQSVPKVIYVQPESAKRGGRCTYSHQGEKDNLTVSSDGDDYSQGSIDDQDDEFEELLLLAAALDDDIIDLMFLQSMSSRRDSNKRCNKV